MLRAVRTGAPPGSDVERDYADLARMQGQLRERAAALAESLDTLRSTQRELVRREKLASLAK